MRARQAGWGTLYGLGVGPGDPELITLKALRILKSVPTLLLPVRRKGDQGLAWAIAEPHVAAGQRVVRLPFPQDAGSSTLDEQWDSNCARILEAVAGGEEAALLSEGDPLLYSSFIELASRLRSREPDLPIEIVPGVSSITAGAAASGLPLVAGAGRLAVLPAIYSTAELRPTLRDFDTVVLVKVNQVMDQIVAALDEFGLAERALLVERCGRPEQRVVRGLAGWSHAEVDYFSLIIVSK
jgi:precorrin-2/cobalt-factor-2 C20-methyltransferase